MGPGDTVGSGGRDGTIDGATVGDRDGERVGATEGRVVGSPDAVREGAVEGIPVGGFDSVTVGDADGFIVGSIVGTLDGEIVGAKEVGGLDARFVGDGVGCVVKVGGEVGMSVRPTRKSMAIRVREQIKKSSFASSVFASPPAPLIPRLSLQQSVLADPGHRQLKALKVDCNASGKSSNLAVAGTKPEGPLCRTYLTYSSLST